MRVAEREAALVDVTLAGAKLLEPEADADTECGWDLVGEPEAATGDLEAAVDGEADAAEDLEVEPEGVPVPAPPPLHRPKPAHNPYRSESSSSCCACERKGSCAPLPAPA